MKTKIRFLPIALACLVGVYQVTAQGTASNVLANSGFETDPPGESQNLIGWTCYGQSSSGNTFSETGTAAHSGSNYLKAFQADTGSVNDSGIFQDYISGPGATYTADGWAETT